MSFNELGEYEIILRNGEKKCVFADDFEHTNDDLCFIKAHEVVAWFNPHDIIGFRKVKGYEFPNDSETIDETAGYGEEQEHE